MIYGSDRLTKDLTLKFYNTLTKTTDVSHEHKTFRKLLFSHVKTIGLSVYSYIQYTLCVYWIIK